MHKNQMLRYPIFLFLFGLHLLIVAFLAYRSRVVPKFLDLLIAVAGLGYVFDSLTTVLTGSSSDVSSYTFLGEFLLALWLVTQGRRVLRSESHRECDDGR